MPEWLKQGNTAVVTGGASGIGLESARRFVGAKMNVVLADRDAHALEQARQTLLADAPAGGDVVCQPCDVSQAEQVERLRDTVFSRFAGVHCLMNNAGVGIPVGAPWENLAELQQTLSINLWGVIHGCHAFIPAMLAGGEAGAVINTGSKQGITRPPGNYAYNLSKTGVLAYTESVANGFVQVEGCKLTAHLLVPGFVYTPMVSKYIPEKPPFAWTAAQTVDFMLACLERGDFYILCPDNEATREIDEKRIQWNADDLIRNRPALSRWHPDYVEEFKKYMQADGSG